MSLLSAGISALGSVFNYQNQKSNDRKNLAATKKANADARADTRYYFDQNADNKIQRQVADGKKAGLSALASMGASPASMPNIQIGQVHKRAAGNDSGFLLAEMMRLNMQERRHNDQMELLRNQHRENMRGDTGSYTPKPATPTPLDMDDGIGPLTPIFEQKKVDNSGTRPNNADRQWTVIRINGKEHYIRPNTDMSVLEDKIGEMGTLIESGRRSFQFYQDNDYIPSKNDVNKILEDLGLIWDHETTRMGKKIWKNKRGNYVPNKTKIHWK